MKKMHILLLGLLPILLLFVTCARDTPSSVSPSAVQTDITLAKNSNIDAFDMFDAFSGSGAKGNGFVTVEDGVMDLTIHAGFLEADHDYEVHVAVGAADDCGNFAPVTVYEFDITTDKNGKFNFKELGLNLGLASGQYRIDFIVVHADADHGGGSHGGFVLACNPASCVTIN